MPSAWGIESRAGCRSKCSLQADPASTHPTPTAPTEPLPWPRWWPGAGGAAGQDEVPGIKELPQSKIHHIITDLDNYCARTEQGTVTEGARVVRGDLRGRGV